MKYICIKIQSQKQSLLNAEFGSTRDELKSWMIYKKNDKII